MSNDGKVRIDCNELYKVCGGYDSQGGAYDIVQKALVAAGWVYEIGSDSWIKPPNFPIKIGDVITFEASCWKHRNWWQRFAPLWVGGKKLEKEEKELRKFVVTSFGEER